MPALNAGIGEAQHLANPDVNAAPTLGDVANPESLLTGAVLGTLGGRGDAPPVRGSARTRPAAESPATTRAPTVDAVGDAMRAAGFTGEHVDALKREVEPPTVKQGETPAPEPVAEPAPVVQAEKVPENAPEAPRAGPVAISTKDSAQWLASDDPRASVRSRARELFSGRTFQSADGDPILVPWQGIRHGTSGARGNDSLAAMLHLDDLIESSRKVATEPDREGRASIKAVHQYEAPVVIDGNPMTARIFVREHADGHRYYDHAVLENSEPSGMPGGATRESRWPVQPAEGSDASLPEGAGGGRTSDTAAIARADDTAPRAADSEPSVPDAPVGADRMAPDLGATPHGKAPQQARISEPAHEVSERDLSPEDRALVQRTRERAATKPVDETPESSLSREDQELVRQTRERAESARQDGELGETMRRESAERGERDADELGVREPITRVLGGRSEGRVHFVHDEDGLPAEVRRRGTPIKRGNVRYGLHTPEGNTYIFTKHANTPAKALWTAVHEVGHDGWDRFIEAHADVRVGQRTVREQWDKTAELALQNPTLAALADKIGRQRRPDNWKDFTPAQRARYRLKMANEAVQELQAALRTGDWGEIESKYGVKVPPAMRSRVRAAIDNFVRRMQAVLNAIMLKRTGQRDAFTDADVHDLLQSTWEAARRKPGEVPGAEAMDQQGFHGSPHRGIEKEGFKLNKIGTGEGAQAYGWGMYFAGKREIAESYRKNLAGNKTDFGAFEKAHPDLTAEFKSEISDIASRRVSDDEYATELNSVLWRDANGVRQHISDELADRIVKAVGERNRGQLYHAEIPEDHQLLDWDKPLNEQPEGVQKALRDAGWPQTIKDWIARAEKENRPASSLYQFLTHAGMDGAVKPRIASERLNAAGIPGLRYLDGGSRGKGEGSHNYVIWDEAHLNNDVTPYYSEEPAAHGRGSIVEAWRGIAKHEEAFQLPTSKEKMLTGIFRELEPAFKIGHAGDRATANKHGADRAWRVETPQGKDATIYQRGKKVWVDLSDLESGEDGKRIYNAVANYAHNTDRVFTGDPEGLSDIALQRRTENMLSSALKFGTTRHLEPHPRQMAGDEKLGVPAMRWKAGDDEGNLRSLLLASHGATLHEVPEIRDLTFNPDSQRFERLSDGSEFTNADFDKLAGQVRGRVSQGASVGLEEAARARAAGRGDWEALGPGNGGAFATGRRSLKRAVFTHALLREAGGGQSDLLARHGSERLERPLAEPLHDLLYSDEPADRADKEPKPIPGVEASEPRPELKRGFIERALTRLFPSAQEILSGARMAAAPMAEGSVEARAAAKDFANNMRSARWRGLNLDQTLKKTFTRDQLQAMWDAADEQSVLMQKGEDATDKGLDRLPAEQRQWVEMLQADAKQAYDQARELGMVEGEGLPSYTPRMLVKLGDNGVQPVAADPNRPRSLNPVGGNVRTSTGNLRQRRHLTAEETEQAAQAKFGEGAQLVRNLRTLPMATARLREAIAGRSLINKIREIGRSAGETTVTEGSHPNDGHRWFTLDGNPAFSVWRPRMRLDEATDGGLREMAAAPPAELRRTHQSIPLLPSGPGGVFDLASRRHQRGHHEQ